MVSSLTLPFDVDFYHELELRRSFLETLRGERDNDTDQTERGRANRRLAVTVIKEEMGGRKIP